MSLTGTDDMGAWLDSGVNTLPTARPNCWLDQNTVLGTKVSPQTDTGTSTKNAPKAQQPSGRSSTQRR